MGLGLAIIKKIIENYNGSISFKSEEEKGTLFTVKLPIKN
jgi:signal transduction histidine kinase